VRAGDAVLKIAKRYRDVCRSLFCAISDAVDGRADRIFGLNAAPSLAIVVAAAATAMVYRVCQKSDTVVNYVNIMSYKPKTPDIYTV